MTTYDKVCYLLGRQSYVLIYLGDTRYYVLEPTDVKGTPALRSMALQAGDESVRLAQMEAMTPDEREAALTDVILTGDERETVLYAARKEPGLWFEINDWQNDKRVRWQRVLDSMGLTDEILNDFFKEPVDAHTLTADQIKELWIHYAGL